MNTGYAIRLAKRSDAENIHKLVRAAVAYEKKCSDPMEVKSGFMDEFVDKAIARGQMLVIENGSMELEMIGEIHDYALDVKRSGHIKELNFTSRMDGYESQHGKELITWLYSEIQNKYKDVFRVKMTAAVNHSSTVEYYKSLGFMVEGTYSDPLNHGGISFMIPFSWNNPSFN